jgi:hypothetical protein
MAEVDTRFIENIEQKLAERTSLAVFMEQLQNGSVDFVRQCIASLEGQLLSLGEKIFHAREVSAPQSLKYSVFLQWQNDMKSLLGEYEKTLEQLQRLFRNYTVLTNYALRGVRVETACAVSGGSVSVPVGAQGMLTGRVTIAQNKVSLDALRALAYDRARVCEVLAHDAGFAVTHSEGASYWDVISELTGDYFLAAHLALQVDWDETKMLGHSMYTPWLRILK